MARNAHRNSAMSGGEALRRPWGSSASPRRNGRAGIAAREGIASACSQTSSSPVAQLIASFHRRGVSRLMRFFDDRRHRVIATVASRRA